MPGLLLLHSLGFPETNSRVSSAIKLSGVLGCEALGCPAFEESLGFVNLYSAVNPVRRICFPQETTVEVFLCKGMHYQPFSKTRLFLYLIKDLSELKDKRLLFCRKFNVLSLSSINFFIRFNIYGGF